MHHEGQPQRWAHLKRVTLKVSIYFLHILTNICFFLLKFKRLHSLTFFLYPTVKWANRTSKKCDWWATLDWWKKTKTSSKTKTIFIHVKKRRKAKKRTAPPAASFSISTCSCGANISPLTRSTAPRTKLPTHCHLLLPLPPKLHGNQALPPPLGQMLGRFWAKSGTVILLSCEFIYLTLPRLDALHWLSLPLFLSLFHQPLSVALSPSIFLLLCCLCPLSYPAYPSLLLFVSVCSIEPGLRAGYSCRAGRSIGISHARHRWALLSIQQDCWHRL